MVGRSLSVSLVSRPTKKGSNFYPLPYERVARNSLLVRYSVKEGGGGRIGKTIETTNVKRVSERVARELKANKSREQLTLITQSFGLWALVPQT